MTIGITIGLTKEYESLWVNGIKLNALFLANALSQIEGNTVWILDTSRKVEDLTKVMWDVNKFPVKDFYKAHNEVDVLITLGTSFPEESLKAFKSISPNKRVVKYMCGNNYTVDMERSLFTDGKNLGKAAWDIGADQVWYVPQQEYQNHYYYETIFKAETFPVPFVWDPMFLESDIAHKIKHGKKTPIYKEGVENYKKRISVFEPNLNVLKFAMLPILITERAYRNNVEFDTLFIASGEKLLKNDYFKSMIVNLDIVKNGTPKVKFTPRYPVSHYLAESAEVVLSHQWENPLNYSYLDALYLNFPLVHNAEMIKDMGYYYPDFNAEIGSQMLKTAIEDHDQNAAEYNKKHHELLKRYTIENKKLIETYKMLLENLYEPNKHNLSHKYDWQTNTYF
jgi:hypothetical protein